MSKSILDGGSVILTAREGWGGLRRKLWRPIVMTTAAIGLAGCLQGCAAFVAMPLAAQVTTTAAGVGILGALTSFDVTLINEYCSLRTGAANCHPGTPQTPAAK